MGQQARFADDKPVILPRRPRRSSIDEALWSSTKRLWEGVWADVGGPERLEALKSAWAVVSVISSRFEYPEAKGHVKVRLRRRCEPVGHFPGVWSTYGPSQDGPRDVHCPCCPFLHLFNSWKQKTAVANSDGIWR